MQASQSVILDIYEQKTFSQMMRGIMICYKEWLVISVSLHKLKCQCTEIVHLSVAKKGDDIVLKIETTRQPYNTKVLKW